MLRPGALGDTLLALPAIRAIRTALSPSGVARIDIVGYPKVLELAVNPLHANAALSIDRGLFASLFSAGPRPELEAFVGAYSFIVAWCRGALLEGLGVPYIECPAYPEPPSRLHATDHLLSSLRRVGIRALPASPELVIPRSAHDRARIFLAGWGLEKHRFITIHPGSGSAVKNYPPEGFARLACLAREEEFAVLLIEGEADEEAVQNVKARLRFPVHVVRGLDLLDLAAILSLARAYYGSDSGVSHLAAATGVPAVVWFGPTDPAIWAPRGNCVEIVTGFTKPEEIWSRSKQLMRESHGV